MDRPTECAKHSRPSMASAGCPMCYSIVLEERELAEAEIQKLRDELDEWHRILNIAPNTKLSDYRNEMFIEALSRANMELRMMRGIDPPRSES